MISKQARIVFMGTPEFATGCLKTLVENGYNVVGVVTVADKPAGRGKKMSESSVKQYAQTQGLPLLQPEKLRDEDFLKMLEEWNADLQVVVAFRMLPEAVWKMPKLGTFNLHASLLPDYRGAAPINWAVINSDTESGVTTFMIDEKIDTGAILLQEKVTITETMSAGELHDELQVVGSNLIMKTIDGLVNKTIEPVMQDKREIYKQAPKLFKENCKIDWTQTSENIYNLIRGLSPYPAAWTELQIDDKIVSFKIIKTQKIVENHILETGTIILEKKQFKIAVKDGFLQIEQAQIQGKSIQNEVDLVNGLRNFSAVSIKKC